nr:armadillo repeat-containing protein 12 isoform X3 [Kogia breviceps]
MVELSGPALRDVFLQKDGLRSATTRLSEAPWSGRGERTARFPAPALPVARDLHVASLRLPLPSRPSITAFRSPQPEQSRLCPLGRGTLLTPPGRCGPPDSCWASACTNDDITLVGSMLVDKDNSVKIQALNTLKAFSGIRKFRLKIQEHSIKVLELISTIWDSELHIAGLRLLNNLPLPDFAHPQLRRVMPALMEILQSDYILAQVQAARLLSNLAQKNDLLYDILNCQVHSNFLDLFQSTQPGSLLLEVLVFAEWLSEGRSSPHYRAVKWHYNEQSVHEALFGDDSRLADRLLALVIHPEEDVQIQACKVIVSLQCPQDVGVQPSCPPSHSCFNNAE